MNVEVYDERIISKYRRNGLISNRDNIYRGINFWIERKKNKISHLKYKEIDGIHKWRGGIPNLRLKAIMNKILKRLSCKKKKDVYNKENINRSEAKVWMIK